ncbi:GNAT family N-acetyltransferase [Shewanella sp. C32]|uniref:GNAT family N-acetyltransferase n=1 Tax=Shewanella electrica TaxID=515560 RepID=A0ABT2FH64_9GAMM|nr:GNAT family N-acetyltransferase [Shewanella electrica]MCH1923577.1 GNAT family N-acetyltransferase [Shewanella electrica]MCS4555673.1 GNAT family N-acetyltransferase [Shewanella electrica]
MRDSVWKWQLVDDIRQIDAATWDDVMQPDTPFNCHSFLCALEQSGCASADSGWLPMHLVLYQQDELVAVLPLYRKLHSYGEYVFDWAWADAYERYQLAYYPKLVTAMPFTPATGVRLGIKQGVDRQTVFSLIIQVLQSELVEHSSWHGLFMTEAESLEWQQASLQPATMRASTDAPTQQARLLPRQGCQYHWHNRQYQSFDDFLEQLTSSKRKNIRKERRQVAEWDYRWRSGSEISAAVWQRFFLCYRMTYLKRSGHGGYLNQAFFQSLSEFMADSVKLLLVCAHGDEDAQAVACALYFHAPDSDTLYGRYWGCLEEYDGLHFETCYYRGIDYCITHQLACFNAGAQGEHKVLRGFEPVITYSWHLIAEPAFEQAISEFCQAEIKQNQTYMLQLVAALPYKQTAS